MHKKPGAVLETGVTATGTYRSLRAVRAESLAGIVTPMPMDLTRFPEQWPPPPPGQRDCIAGGGAAGPNFTANMQGVSRDDFANFLSSGLRPVVNKTGI
jgi:hypothetical protein